jgi:hypothetical protein
MSRVWTSESTLTEDDVSFEGPSMRPTMSPELTSAVGGVMLGCQHFALWMCVLNGCGSVFFESQIQNGEPLQSLPLSSKSVVLREICTASDAYK